MVEEGFKRLYCGFIELIIDWNFLREFWVKFKGKKDISRKVKLNLVQYLKAKKNLTFFRALMNFIFLNSPDQIAHITACVWAACAAIREFTALFFHRFCLFFHVYTRKNILGEIISFDIHTRPWFSCSYYDYCTCFFRIFAMYGEWVPGQIICSLIYEIWLCVTL